MITRHEPPSRRTRVLPDPVPSVTQPDTMLDTLSAEESTAEDATAEESPLQSPPQLHPYAETPSVDVASQTISTTTTCQTTSIQVAIPDFHKDQIISRLKSKIRQLRAAKLSMKHSMANLRAANLRLKRRVEASKKECSKCQQLSLLPTHTTVFLEEQVECRKKDRKGMRWSTSTISIAQAIMYKSPSCYTKLREFFAFPSTSTLCRRAPNVTKEVS